MLFRLYLLLTFSILCHVSALAQSSPVRTIVRGVVIDSLTKETLPGVTVLVSGTTIGASTDMDGAFMLNIKDKAVSDTLVISYIGFQTKRVKYDAQKTTQLKISLQPERYALESVVVRASRTRYSRRDNPAVALAKKLIDKNQQIDPRAMHREYNFERYEKINISLSNFDTEFRNKKLASLKEHRDTNSVTGVPFLPLSIKERLIRTTVVNREKSEKIIASRSEGVDDKLSQENIEALTSVVLAEINIFDNEIDFLTRKFVGPLSNISLGFFKYYLAPDTVLYDGARCVQLSFSPYDRESLNFSGKLYVTADSTLFVRGAELSFPNSTNINFVYDMRINQNFEQSASGERLLVKDDTRFKFNALSQYDKIGFDIGRINSYRDYRFSAEVPKVIPEKADAKYWARMRHIPITIQEQKVDIIAAKFRKVSIFKLAELFLILLSEEYIPTGPNSKFDVGPVLSFISSNALEGTRLKVGGVTTPKFMPNLFLEGYAAYGFKDKKVKWNAAVEYSFAKRHKSIREFPVHSLRAEVGYDVHKFGRPGGDVAPDNIFSWIKRQADSSLTYIRNFQLTYTSESKTNFSYYLTTRHYIQTASNIMNFVLGDELMDYRMSEVSLRLRFAPGEKLFQNNSRRKAIDKYRPVYEVSHTAAFKGLIGGDYSRNLTELGFLKRFNLAALGTFDAHIRAGAEWNVVPFMLLPHPYTNLTYVLKRGSFSLMNPLEFMYDRFLQWDVEWHLDGLILNKIPLIKALQLREVISMKGVYAKLTDKNNPMKNANLIPFPKASSALGHQPYMEIGFGIENIFKFLRVDYVRRLTYTGKSGTNDWGIICAGIVKL